ncbi:MAG: Regulatory protein of adaptative response [Candidatus Accumulibacter appositus]|uniref:methylated-DNA--[protein]-cysteine S-methyltransferase n=1 Tax=Candidatus Accumulibacter appositus TaxID=1454003 RepID=A0A011PKM6_9PROT|nr:methylated-DNA--[protein]-cysteine S-methyltransferase [Accumulibacter sp.]EXI77587.1 MAG: Regulatory protein of adaptative response [Candidatus Accumulibacter appositus]HRF03957.1 methylated-DNA--[protein]-cysteine S-methyltransferase [Accumulibacter sp.]
MNDLAVRCRAYETIARAIRFIKQRGPGQPSLQEVAAHVGMSHFHLQRLFSVWAGISPKRFLQYLTTEHARSLLRGEYDVLSAAHAAGLSGPGRLHDLMITCDAATPGEVRSLGEGLLITYGFGPTPFGRVIAGTTARGLCHLQFVNSRDNADDNTYDDAADAAAMRQLQDDWQHARLLRDDSALATSIERAFPLAGHRQPLHILLRGTNFQIKVWQALLAIAPGGVISYGELAKRIDHPRAQRAVGSALARNRIAVLIPCHRVIRENGDIGSYRWGGDRKQVLLAVEAGYAHSRPGSERRPRPAPSFPTSSE